MVTLSIAMLRVKFFPPRAHAPRFLSERNHTYIFILITHYTRDTIQLRVESSVYSI